MDGVDLFSALPSSLLIIIISLLSFKEAARTSILSKQWQHIWRDTINIQFNENFFVRHDEPEEEQNVQRNAFIDFARQFILSYSQPVVQSFELTCSKQHNFPVDMQTFITFAISRNVKDFALDFSDPTWTYDNNYDAVFELPLHFYKLRASLQSLKLYSCSFEACRFTNFSVLTTVSLGWIEISMSTLRGLLENCPMLGDLSLKKCWNTEHFEISMKDLRLKILVIDNCDFIEELLFIDGPQLRYFKYYGILGPFYLKNQRAIVEADLDFGMQPSFEEIGLFLYRLLEDLFTVRVLRICSVFLQIVPSGDYPFGLKNPMLISHLVLKTAMHANEFCGIMFMLKSCPFLNALTIDIGPAIVYQDYMPPYKFNPHRFWSTNPPILHCIFRTLKVVTVKGFKGTLNELLVLRYIISLGSVLEQLNIYLSNEGSDNEANREIYLGRAHKVLQFRRASRNLNTMIFNS